MLEGYNADAYFVDIDGTLVYYADGAVTPENTLHGNFLFPIIRDMMVERGRDPDAAARDIFQLTEELTYWDYGDFVARFRLPAAEAHRRMRAWHAENLAVHEDGVAVVRALSARGVPLYILSNNPLTGCAWKLERAGLADETGTGSPFFRAIFGTNVLRGCKGSPGVWANALARVPFAPERLGMIGDNPVEDGEIPRSLGVDEIRLFKRNATVRGIDGAAL